MWLYAPILIPLGISLTIKPVIEPRYASVGLPGMMLLAGALLSNVKAAALRGGMVSVLLAAEALGCRTYFTVVEKEAWRAATDSILSDARPRDAVIFYAPYVRRAYDYYKERLPRPRAPTVLYPSDAYVDYGASGGRFLSLAAALDSARTTAGRTWLVLSHAQPDSICRSALARTLGAAYSRSEDRRFKEIDVWLYADLRAGVSDTTRARQRAEVDSAVRVSCPQQ